MPQRQVVIVGSMWVDETSQIPGGPHPEHPIAPGGPPPSIWPSPGRPAHPIAPGGVGGGAQPANPISGGFMWAYSPIYGWVLVPGTGKPPNVEEGIPEKPDGATPPEDAQPKK